MKVTVLGSSGLIGSKLVNVLRQRGHDVVEAALETGLNTITGAGLAEALAGAQVAVDVTNSPSLEPKAALEFFQTSARSIATAEQEAGVSHHVALSIVGAERLEESGYLRAKIGQERAIKAAPIPYTIVRSTQFFDFLPGIAKAATIDQTVRLSPALVQPIASDDVAAALADVASTPPLYGTIEIAGPEAFGLADVVARFLSRTSDPRRVVADAGARYFGAVLQERSLLPEAGARLGATDFETWFSRIDK